jgi:uncharacterized protein YndB with AHSA1/START domain
MQAQDEPEADMSDSSFTTSFTVDMAPEEVFDAIKDVRSWWMTQVEGNADAVGDEFGYQVEGVHRVRIQVEELVPAEKVVWRVVDNWFGFVDDPREWQDTAIRFDIARTADGAEVRFTHDGLTAADECFDVCSSSWSLYVGASLPSRITTGVGTPGSNDEETRSRAPITSGG